MNTMSVKTKYYEVVSKYQIGLDFMRQLASNRTWIKANCKDGYEGRGCKLVEHKINVVHVLRCSYYSKNLDSLRSRWRLFAALALIIARSMYVG